MSFDKKSRKPKQQKDLFRDEKCIKSNLNEESTEEDIYYYANILIGLKNNGRFMRERPKNVNYARESLNSQNVIYAKKRQNFVTPNNNFNYPQIYAENIEKKIFLYRSGFFLYKNKLFKDKNVNHSIIWPKYEQAIKGMSLKKKEKFLEFLEKNFYNSDILSNFNPSINANKKKQNLRKRVNK